MNQAFPPSLAWRLSPQIYAWRVRERSQGVLPAFVLAGVDDAIAAGCDGIELNLSVLSRPGRAEALGDLLRSQGLRLAALFANASLGATQESLAEIARQAAEGSGLGCSLLNLAVQPDLRGSAGERCGASAEVLSRLGGLLEGTGVKLQWHPHEEDLVGDGADLDRILGASDPARVGLCLDMGWLLKTDCDPAPLIERHGDRLGILHLRDHHAGIWMQALGEGDMQLPELMDALEALDFGGWLCIELWFDRATPVTRTLQENAIESARAIRQALSRNGD